MVSDAMRRSVRWPKAPSALGNALRRVASNLRAVGIELQFSRNDVQGRRMVSVVSAAPVRKTPSVATATDGVLGMSETMSRASPTPEHLALPFLSLITSL
jgi:hypothetical protein